MRKLCCYLLISLVMTMGGNLVRAKTGDTLHTFLQGLTNLSADFQQIEYDEHQKEIRQSQGTLSLQRPGRFRWEYQTPARQTIVSDGANVWFYDHDLAQVTVKSYASVLVNSPALLLSSDQPLENDFHITETGSRDGLTWVEIRPKTQEASFVKATVGFMGHELQIMHLQDNFGQTTSLKFSQVQRNPSLPAELFRFRPPPGVDVVGKEL